ncbi:hypothetical protein ASE35_19570 [Lysobacter sp. Root916]|uniref:sensor histidine kinase n=1 Tax=Lysobacter sp. Root916 TaxID=1736606 RepID=UPI00070B7DF9|nr:histidine kinase dimerization/phosphoacceptor domain -containing protein [Lysobacter sp. Root916]KRD28700.1 hypothetical protein ASE35_19570 [Lysobacter sp. Root916]
MNSLALLLILACALLPLATWHAARRHGRREESRRLIAVLDALSSHTPVAFVAWEPRAGIVLWSAGAQRLFEVDATRMLGQPLPAGLDALHQAAAGLEGARPATRLELRRANGATVDAIVSFAGGGDGVIVAAIEDAVSSAANAHSAEVARAQRDALVREVHHRIKNSLQGVTGLLRQHLSDKPLLKPLLEAASAQVSAIAAVHGLHGEAKDGQINLRMLMVRVAASVSGIMHAPITVSDRCAALERFSVNEEESVPVAMVLNELIMNAAKHRSRSGVNGIVAIDAIAHAQRAEILVSNPGFLPANFDFSAGVSLGNGLGLIRSLLPRRGASIGLAEEGRRVVATLALHAPDVLSESTKDQEAIA